MNTKTNNNESNDLKQSPYKGITGIKRLILAGGYSLQGLKAAWKNEAAIRQELMVALILIPTGLYFGNTNIEKLLLIFSVLLLIIVELLNSAIEAVVDKTGYEYHELSGRAKDMGSAAVLITLLFGIASWLLILL